MNVRRDILGVARNLGARLRRSGGEWIGPCPSAAARTGSPSIRARVSGTAEAAAVAAMPSISCAMSLAFHSARLSRSSTASRDPIARATRRAVQDDATEALPRAAPPRADGRGLGLWRMAAPIDHTPADLYLRERGFAPPYPATLRYLPGDRRPSRMR